MGKFTSIEELKIVLDIHRKRACVTCPEDCLCWDIESYLAGIEANQQSFSLRIVEVLDENGNPQEIVVL